MSGSLMQDGVVLMLYGMGVVLFFLTALVAAVTLMSTILTRYFPESDGAQPSVDPRHVKAIQAALDLHRRRR